MTAQGTQGTVARRAAPGWGRRGQRVLWQVLLVLVLWLGSGAPAIASLHTYHERPGQVTVRSRQSLRDEADRAWQAVAFKRIQGDQLQGLYLRLIGFPGAVQVDRQQPLVLMDLTGQSWQLPWALDSQTQTLPGNVGQFDLQPLLGQLPQARPLELQIPVVGEAAVTCAIAPFIVREWLQVEAATPSSVPIAPPLGE